MRRIYEVIRMNGGFDYHLDHLDIIIKVMEGDGTCEDQLFDVTTAAGWEADGVLVGRSADVALTIIESDDLGEVDAFGSFDSVIGGETRVAAVMVAKESTLTCWSKDIVQKPSGPVINSSWVTIAAHPHTVLIAEVKTMTGAVATSPRATIDTAVLASLSATAAFEGETNFAKALAADLDVSPHSLSTQAMLILMVLQSVD